MKVLAARPPTRDERTESGEYEIAEVLALHAKVSRLEGRVKRARAVLGPLVGIDRSVDAAVAVLDGVE